MAQIVTITNPLTGQPAQVDQLDHTAQQIDDGLNIARGVSNPNLLDNGYFGNPVDQRQGRIVKPNTTYYSDNQLTTAAGTTSTYVTAYRYTPGTASGVNYAAFKLEDKDTAPTYYAAPENVVRGYIGTRYGIDRWKISNGGSGTCWMLIEDDGITIGTDTKYGVYFIQAIDPSVVKALAGKTVTLSVLAGGKSGAFSGNIYINGSWNDYWAIKANDVSTKKYTIPANATSMSIQYAESGSGAGTCKLKAVKLELGTQQTLAHQDENGNWVLNEIPDYGEQLARCQRELYRDGGSDYTSVGYGLAESGKTAYFLVKLPVPMRVRPSVTYAGNWTVWDGVTGRAIESISINSVATNPKDCSFVNIRVVIADSDLTTGKMYQLCVRSDKSAYIEFSAEL